MSAAALVKPDYGTHPGTMSRSLRIVPSRRKSKSLDDKCAALKAKLTGEPVRKPAVSLGVDLTWNLRQAAARTGQTYSSAYRMFSSLADEGVPGVRRYSNSKSGQAVFPGTTLKRFQRVRLTWRITESAIQHAIALMEGQRSNVA